MDIQLYLFDTLESRFTKKREMVRSLAELLSMSEDAIYRRVRGQTAITPEQISLIARHYRISLDALIHKDQSSVFFNYSAFQKPIRHIDDFISNFYEIFSQLESIKNAKIYYASNEIPLFYYAFFPKLFIFKLYVWGQSIWRINQYIDNKFSFDLFHHDLFDKARFMVQKYCEYNSIELWSLNLVENTINQIEYQLNVGMFAHPEDALELCNEIIKLIDHFSAMAEKEYKFLPGADRELGHFALYHNEMIYTNNTILFHSPEFKRLFVTFANPNYLQSMDPNICEYTANWFDGLARKCTPLSGNTEKSRGFFMNNLRRSVERKKMSIENYILSHT